MPTITVLNMEVPHGLRAVRRPYMTTEVKMLCLGIVRLIIADRGWCHRPPGAVRPGDRRPRPVLHGRRLRAPAHRAGAARTATSEPRPGRGLRRSPITGSTRSLRPG